MPSQKSPDPGIGWRLLCPVVAGHIVQIHSFYCEYSPINITIRPLMMLAVPVLLTAAYAGQHSLCSLYAIAHLRTFQKSVRISSDSPPCSPLHFYKSLSLWTSSHISLASGEEGQLNSACSSTELEAFIFILLL